VVTFNTRTLIPIYPKPLKTFKDWFQSGFQITDFISVINPQNEFPAVAFSK
jgi:hypothetical protein